MARIGVDLDGVVYNFGDALREFVYRYENVERGTLPNPTSWEFYEVDWGWDLDKFMYYFTKGVDAGFIFVYGGAEAGAAKNIARLRDDGHSIHIITHRSVGTHSVSNTGVWLKRAGIEYDELCFSKDKTTIPTDIFIEDNVENFLALEAVGTRAFIMDRLWNRHLDTSHRVSSWDEFYERVQAHV